MGIPASEIQFIQIAKTEKARKKIFEGMNNDTIRVLFGSTFMFSTGVNAQQRTVAVHHLEVPWRPADLEQRNGRAVRKGNTVKLWGGNVVDIIIYGTEKTLGAYKFNILRNKQLFINQINNGTIAVRRIDEDGMDEDTGRTLPSLWPSFRATPTFWIRRSSTIKSCSWKRNRRLSTKIATGRSARLRATAKR